MASVKVTRTLDHPVDKIWAVLADHGNVSSFHPNIIGSKYIVDKKGVGGSRACEFRGGKGVNETVTKWDEHKAMSFEATEFRGLPMKQMNGHFHLSGDGPTQVTFEMEYAMKGGCLMNLMARRMMRDAGVKMLTGLNKKLSSQ